MVKGKLFSEKIAPITPSLMPRLRTDKFVSSLSNLKKHIKKHDYLNQTK